MAAPGKTVTVSTTPASADATRALALDAARLSRLAERVVASEGAETRATRSPVTGDTLATLKISTPEDVAKAYAASRAAQAAWAATPVDKRARVLLRYHDLVLDRQDEVLDLIWAETGKARPHAYEEVADSALVSRHYARTAPRHLRTARHRGVVPMLTRADEVRHPKGVVGIIAPWNYPLTLSVGDAVPALVAGNGVVLKPDSQTPLTALWAVDLLEEAGLPAGLFQVVYGPGAVLGPALVDGADYVSFTGSTATGRTVAERAGARLIGCSLELGGKNPLIVLADADLERAAEGAVRSCFSNAGQLCISTERVIVERQAYEAFTEKFLARVQAIQVGADTSWDVDMGSLVSASQLETVQSHVSDAVDKGATVLAGGNQRPDLGPYFFEPTVLSGVTPEMRCYADETFGPLVSMFEVADADEAVMLANDTPYGLNASIWTRDAARGRRLATRVRAGTVNVNEAYAASWASMAAPMGGMGDSGLGRRHGAEGLLKYTEPQTVATQRLLSLGADARPRVTQQKWARMFTASLRLLRRTGLS